MSLRDNPYLPNRTWTVMIRTGSTVLASTSVFLGTGETNSEFAEGGFEITPVVIAEFDAGDVDSINLVISPDGFGGVQIGWKGDDYIQLCFTPE